MKKMILIIVIIMAGVLTGCGGTKSDEKIIYVGTNAEYKPYEYLENGKIVGFDIELMEEIGRSMGYEVKWTNMSFDGLLPALQSGKVDMVVAGMTPTEERKKAVDFTEIYYSSGQAILVNSEENKGIKTEIDLEGKVVGVQMGSMQEKVAGDLGASEIKRYNSFTGAILDLNEDKIDFVIVGDAVAKSYLKANPKISKALVLDMEGSADGSAIALKKNSGDMIAKLNSGIKELKSSGKYDELVQKYFSGQE